MVIACVLKSGGDFDLEYVERLQASVREYTDVPFVCLSDIEVPNRIPLEHDWPGWWSKLELFKLKDVLYFDLDTVIRGDFTDILKHPHKFTMLSDLGHPQRLASGIMAWSDAGFVYEAFKKNPKEIISQYRGDQDFIAEKPIEPERFQNLFPGMITSYKINYNPNSPIVCFHGKPRPREVNWQCPS